MPKNDFFQFKQFRVGQGQCAMKVCTDACILGAWAARSQASRILDVGAGTGLLSLMLAQRHLNAKIDAVEIDEAAAGQCQQNFANSPWHSRLSVHQLPIQQFFTEGSYDLVVSNPPFFPQHLLSNDAQRNKAHHTTELPFDALMGGISRLLSPSGHAFVMLPPRQADDLATLGLAHGLHLQQSLLISDSPEKKPIRRIDRYGRNTSGEAEICAFYIKNNSHTYTSEFAALLADYYLIF